MKKTTVFITFLLMLVFFVPASYVQASDTTAPTTPTGLTAQAVSSSQINLFWTASGDDVGVAGYKIYRCAGLTCAPTVQIATSVTNSYSDTELTASTTYTYTVSAYDGANNESAKSSSASATTLIQTGNVYYISPNGNDSNSGTSEAVPFKTFTKAFQIMQGGDTLYVMDGVYNQQITGMPSGSPGNYTKIYALNDHQAEIDGRGILPSVAWQALLYIVGNSYVEIRGLKIHSSSADNQVCGVAGSNNIILRVMGCWHAGDSKYSYPLQIGNSSNILLEDVWAFGRGRATIDLASNATNVTVRRAVARWDAGNWPNEPIAGIKLYKAYNNLIENSITLDHLYSGNPSGHQGFRIISRDITTGPESTENSLYGNIAINLPNDTVGFSISTYAITNNSDNNYVKDCVTVGSFIGANILKDTDDNTFENCTFINNASQGFFNASEASGTVIKNTISANNSGYGFSNNYGGMTISYSGAYENTSGNYSGTSCSPGCKTDDAQLLYPVRVEDTSTYKGAGEDGADIGANIIYRYVNGVLTDQPLWPWPYEDWIKEDMCDPDFLSQVRRTGANTPKWCTTNKTLTQYIWEYLGNPCPSEICGTTAPLKGDINQDDLVDVLDIQALVNHILGTQDYGVSADVNKDSSVDALDVQCAVNIILCGICEGGC